VHTASIRRFCAGAYTPAQIEEWTETLAPDRYLDSIKTLEIVVAEIDDQVEGFCILDPGTGEIHAIYLSPAAAGKGFGRQLMAWAERTARAHGWTELFLKATLNAVPFYEKCGFVAGLTTNHPLPSGTVRACVEMRKSLE
jgi:GNAT superfamily N-acetyltransferase